jgi:hypothetical protein
MLKTSGLIGGALRLYLIIVIKHIKIAMRNSTRHDVRDSRGAPV